MSHPGLIAWLMFGVVAFMAVSSSARLWVNHRKFIPVFALVIILAGPLSLLLAFIPAPTVQGWAQIVRDWLDKHDQ